MQFSSAEPRSNWPYWHGQKISFFPARNVLAGCGLALGAAALAWGTLDVSAQTVLRSSPNLPFRQPEPAKYNLKWGKMQARISGEVQTEFNDNVNLTDKNRLADWSIGPQIGLGFIYPVSKDHLMQLSLGAGYRFYINSPSINSFNVAPNSAWSHTMSLYGVTLEVYDQFSILTDPTSRGDISGAPAALINFKRLSNTSGLLASYQPTLRWTLNAGYEYTIERSLSDQFTELDADTHTFSLGSYYAVNQRLTTGLTSSYSLSEHATQFQNNGTTFSVGPVLSLKATSHIYVQLSLAYTSSTFDDSGTTGDTSEFEGLTFQAAINHQLNRRISHSLRFSRSVTPGYGSNFSDTFSAQYTITTPLSRNLSLNSSLGYESFESSGLGETADRFIAHIATSYQLSQKWSTGISYSLASKDSSVSGRDYIQNRVTVGFVRQF